MCKNSAGYNRTRNFGLHGHAESKKTQKFVLRSALRPNQISFSHGQDPFRKWSVLVIGREQAGRVGEHRVCSSSDMLDELPWSILLLVDPIPL